MSRTYRNDSRYETRPPRWAGHGHHDARGQRDSSQGGDFRCRNCKLMVGPVPSGGRQRNHCPYCLYSRHVDDRTPGDRASDCGALMAPIGTFSRESGEQVVLHRCLGCGFQRYNRVAADDNYVGLMRLPLVARPIPSVQVRSIMPAP